MKNKSILAIMPATAIGFVNAGIFDDIGNGIAGTLSFLLLKKPNNPLIIIFLTKKYLFY
jgi:hypothetical protein